MAAGGHRYGKIRSGAVMPNHSASGVHQVRRPSSRGRLHRSLLHPLVLRNCMSLHTLQCMQHMVTVLCPNPDENPIRGGPQMPEMGLGIGLGSAPIQGNVQGCWAEGKVRHAVTNAVLVAAVLVAALVQGVVAVEVTLPVVVVSQYAEEGVGGVAMHSRSQGPRWVKYHRCAYPYCGQQGCLGVE